MKLILFILINLPFLFAIKTYNNTAGCTVTNINKLLLLKCLNVTWNGEETLIDLPSTKRNVIVNPFSASNVWLDEDVNVIGMSDKDKFVIVWKDKGTNFTNSQKMVHIKERLKRYSYFIPADDPPKEAVNEKRRDNLHLRNDEDFDPSVPDFIQYVHTHVYNHKNVLDWLMEQYFDEDKPAFSELGYNGTYEISRDLLNTYYPQSKFIYPVEKYQYLMLCGDKMVEINFFEDLSSNEWRECVNPRKFDPMVNITWHNWMWDALEYPDMMRMYAQSENIFWLSEKFNDEGKLKSLWDWLLLHHRKYYEVNHGHPSAPPSYN